jgi:rubrerythrin
LVEPVDQFSQEENIICSVRVHTTEGEAPDPCPVCGARREMFRKF